MKKKIKNNLVKLGRLIYDKLFLADDTPQRIALGFGLGVFLGVMPAMGPVASLVLSSLFRLNRPAALLGSVLFNTWINFLTFLLAIKIGSVIMGLKWSLVYSQSVLIFNDFSFAKLFKLPVIKIISPIVVGYFVIGACASIIAYSTVLLILKITRKKRQQA